MLIYACHLPCLVVLLYDPNNPYGMYFTYSVFRCFNIGQMYANLLELPDPFDG